MFNFVDAWVKWTGRGLTILEREPDGPIHWFVFPFMVVFLGTSLVLTFPVAGSGHFLKWYRGR